MKKLLKNNLPAQPQIVRYTAEEKAISNSILDIHVAPLDTTR